MAAVAVAAGIGWFFFGIWGAIAGGGIVVGLYVVLEVQYMRTRDAVEELEEEIQNEP